MIFIENHLMCSKINSNLTKIISIFRIFHLILSKINSILYIISFDSDQNSFDSFAYFIWFYQKLIQYWSKFIRLLSNIYSIIIKYSFDFNKIFIRTNFDSIISEYSFDFNRTFIRLLSNIHSIWYSNSFDSDWLRMARNSLVPRPAVSGADGCWRLLAIRRSGHRQMFN